MHLAYYQSMKTNIDIINGCGKGKKCIGTYFLPQGLTREAFIEYMNEQKKLFIEHSVSDKIVTLP